jgi:hypothetical protein
MLLLLLQGLWKATLCPEQGPASSLVKHGMQAAPLQHLNSSCRLSGPLASPRHQQLQQQLVSSS